MRSLVHPVLARQLSAPQPGLTTVLASLAVPLYLPGLIASGLLHWRPFWTFTARHNDGYYIGMLLVQLSLALGVVAFLSWRYGSAIWSSEPITWHRLFIALAILAPLLVFDATILLPQIEYILSSASQPNRAAAKQALASCYQLQWDAAALGTSPAAITTESIRTLAVPIHEEVVFTGFLLNLVAKRNGIGFGAAALVVSVCFAAGHILMRGVGAVLVPVFFLGLTCTMVRICSGALSLAILAHFIHNAFAFVPKWIAAAYWFKGI